MHQNMVDEFIKTVKEKYTKAMGYEPSFYLSKAGRGAGEVVNWKENI